MLASIAVGLPWNAVWHTTRPFETVFSPPHLFVCATTALTVGLYLLLLTMPCLRLTLGRGFRVPSVPFAVPAPLFLIGAGLVLLAFSLGPLLGPSQHNQTAEKVAAIAAIPVLALRRRISTRRESPWTGRSVRPTPSVSYWGHSGSA